MSITIMHECKCKPLVADLLAALKALSAEFVRVYPVYYYAEPWAHDRNVPLKLAQELVARAEGGAK